tara:strand:+ start:148 stop:450 length:303 start_codon:yes stop_codon:yes gene_type:complete
MEQVKRDIYNIILIHTARTWERIRVSKPNQEMVADNIESTELIQEISTDIFSNPIVQEFICLKVNNSVPTNFWDKEGDSFSDIYIERLATEIINKNYIDN